MFQCFSFFDLDTCCDIKQGFSPAINSSFRKVTTALYRSSRGSSLPLNEFMSFWKWALSGNAQQNLHNLPFINQSIHSTVRADSLRVSPEGLRLNTTDSGKSHSSLPFHIHVMMCDSVI